MLNPFASVHTSLTTAAMIALATFGAVQTIRIEGLWFIHGYKQENATLRLDLEKVRLAGIQAQKDQIAANLAVEARYSAQTERSNESYRTSLAAIRSASDSYAARVRPCPVGGGGPASVAAVSDPASGGDAAGPDAVVLDRGDYDILTGNTARLVEVQRWGGALIQDGLALPARP